MERRTVGAGRWGLRRGLLAAAGVALLSGCVSYTGVKPLYPGHKETVAGLKPTIRWEAADDPGVTYDLVLYEPVPKGAGEETRTDWKRKEAYYREGLEGTSHVVEAPLKPGSRYAWSIRKRSGDNVSEWSLRQTVVFLVVSYDRVRRLPLFDTPER